MFDLTSLGSQAACWQLPGRSRGEPTWAGLQDHLLQEDDFCPEPPRTRAGDIEGWGGKGKEEGEGGIWRSAVSWKCLGTYSSLVKPLLVHPEGYTQGKAGRPGDGLPSHRSMLGNGGRSLAILSFPQRLQKRKTNFSSSRRHLSNPGERLPHCEEDLHP